MKIKCSKELFCNNFGQDGIWSLFPGKDAEVLMRESIRRFARIAL